MQQNQKTKKNFAQILAALKKTQNKKTQNKTRKRKRQCRLLKRLVWMLLLDDIFKLNKEQKGHLRLFHEQHVFALVPNGFGNTMLCHGAVESG